MNVALQVLGSALRAVAEEMGAVLSARRCAAPDAVAAGHRARPAGR